MTIKAIAVAENRIDSPVASFAYTAEKVYPVTLTVTDGESPMNQETVYLGEWTGETDREGKVEFLLQEGMYECAVHADGYESYTRTIEVHDTAIEEKVRLKQLPGMVTGQVNEICLSPKCYPPRPEAVGYASIYVYSGTEFVAETETDENGYFELYDLPLNKDLVVGANFFSVGSPVGRVDIESNVFQLVPGARKNVNLTYVPDGGLEELIDVQVGDRGYDALNVYWEPYGEGYGYRIYLHEFDEMDGYKFIDETGVDFTDFSLGEIKIGTEYSIRIEAWWPGSDFPTAFGEVKATTKSD